jgi:hypothetical protein
VVIFVGELAFRCCSVKIHFGTGHHGAYQNKYQHKVEDAIGDQLVMGPQINKNLPLFLCLLIRN